MFRNVLAAAAVVTGLLAFTAPAQAEPVAYEFDKDHTQIFFSVNHLGFSHSMGRFNEFDGTLTLDQDAPENSAVNVTIATDSIDMGLEAWDDHLKNEDFFHVTEYPEMTFRSTAVEVTGENTANITGDLTILGVTQPVVLETTLNKIGAHPMSGKQHAGFSARGTIQRSAFGMNYGLPNVGDEVEIRIEAEATAADAAGAGTATTE